MADTVTFELVSPERKLASADAQSVTIPGSAGDMTAMPNHAPFLTTMRPGYVVVREGSSETSYFVTGGFAEVSPETVSVLAEEAIEASEVTREWLATRMEAIEKALPDAPNDRAQIEALKLNDYRQISAQLGS